MEAARGQWSSVSPKMQFTCPVSGCGQDRFPQGVDGSSAFNPLFADHLLLARHRGGHDNPVHTS